MTIKQTSAHENMWTYNITFILPSLTVCTLYSFIPNLHMHMLRNMISWEQNNTLRTLAMLWSWQPENWGLMLGRGRDFSLLHGVKLASGAHPQSHATCNRESSPVSKVYNVLKTHVPICQRKLQHTPSNSLYIFRQRRKFTTFLRHAE